MALPRAAARIHLPAAPPLPPAPPCMRPSSTSRLRRPGPRGCARAAASPSRSRGLAQVAKNPSRLPRRKLTWPRPCPAEASPHRRGSRARIPDRHCARRQRHRPASEEASDALQPLLGAATSVTRRPKLPLTSTTSPRATILSPTIRSTGSATWRSSSTTSPGPRSRISPSGISREPKRSEASSSTSSSSSRPGLSPAPGLGRRPESPAPASGVALAAASSALRRRARTSSRTRIVQARSPDRS